MIHKVYEPESRVRLRTAKYFCKAVVRVPLAHGSIAAQQLSGQLAHGPVQRWIYVRGRGATEDEGVDNQTQFHHGKSHHLPRLANLPAPRD